jgi:hypothetical protein
MSTSTPTAMKITSLEPKFGENGNYNIGYIGFTYHSTNIISQGIAYFTRWHRLGEIKASHALIVTGENQCVEAHVETGVAQRDLKDYFDNEHCQIFFRKPKNLTPKIANNMARVADSQVGCQYDIDLIKRLMFAYTHLGWVINKITKDEFVKWLTRQHQGDDEWICSELAAYCLDEQPEYKDQDILSLPNTIITPQKLFESKIFKAWKQ